MLALPVIFYQLWSFVAPALHKHEKKLVIPMFFFATFLFAVRRQPLVVRRAAARGRMADELRRSGARAADHGQEYFGFAISMTLAFGICFELPIVIVTLARWAS